MKKILFLSLCSLFSLPFLVKAQEKRSFVGISVGTSLPVGDYGSLDASNEQSGFAEAGLALDLNYGYQFSKNFGFMASLRGRLNGISEEALSNQFFLPTGRGGSMSIEAGSYKTGALLVGVYESVALSSAEKFFFEVKALAGLQRTTIPEISVTGSIPGFGSFNQTQEAYHANSFAYLFGGAFRYKIGDNLSLKLNGDFNGSKPKFTVPNGSGGEETYKQPTNTIDVTFGLVIGL